MNDDTTRATSRRRFIAGAAGAAIGAGAIGVAGVASGAGAPATTTGRSSVHPDPGRQHPPHRDYRRANFENAKGARVTVLVNGAPVKLTIAHIDPLGVAEGARSGSHLWDNAFRVVLTGPAGTDIPQGTFPVTANGRTFDLFVVPVMYAGTRPRFEAIIHRAYRTTVRG